MHEAFAAIQSDIVVMYLSNYIYEIFKVFASAKFDKSTKYTYVQHEWSM